MIDPEALRILTVANADCDPNSGAAGTVIAINDRFRAMGHHVDEVWNQDLGRRRIAHGNLHYLLEAPGQVKRVVNQRLRETDYDAILISQPTAYLTAKQLREKDYAGVVVNRSHGVEFEYHRALDRWAGELGIEQPRFPKSVLSRWLRKQLDRQWEGIVKYCDGLVLTSTIDRDAIMNRLAPGECDVELIPHGIPEQFAGAAEGRRYNEQPQSLLYVGQYAPFKAPQFLIAILNRILRAYDSLTMTWVTSPESHAAIRSQLSDEVSPRVELREWVTQEALIDIYRGHDVFVFPSVFEGFGKAPLEAMACGACVVASDVGGMHDFIEHERTGMLCPAGDVDNFCGVLRKLIESPGLAAGLAERGRASASELTWRRCAEHYIGYLRNLLDSKRRAESAVEQVVEQQVR